MVKIIQKDKQAKEEEEKKKAFSIDEFRNTFSSMDSFSKIMGVTFVLLLVATPLVISGKFQNAVKATPDYSITNPGDNSVVLAGSTIVLTLQTANPSLVSKVDFYVNGIQQCSVSTTPYICSWNVPPDKNRQYIIETRLYDKQGAIYPKTETVTSGNF